MAIPEGRIFLVVAISNCNPYFLIICTATSLLGMAMITVSFDSSLSMNWVRVLLACDLSLNTWSLLLS
ncbi:MAG: hypothetical protein QXJ17_07335 [Nitrososphaeria archaeon]